MSTPSRQDLERLRYWQGQTLRSRDYRDQSRFDARRRRLHNLALHSVDGVCFGLGVTPRSDDPASFEIACGVACDRHGRDLILQRPRTVSLPGEPSLLVLRYRATHGEASSSCCVPIDPGCVADDALLIDRDVELVWDPLASIARVDGVALAQFTAVAMDLDFRPRQARPLSRPRLARGETVKGNTPWEPWEIDEPDGLGGIRQAVVGVQTHIDTSAAGFTRTPCYFASLETPAWDIAKAEFAPAFFPQVADPSVDGFTFRLLMVETARRRYAASFGTARVKATSRGVGDRLLVDLDSAGAFQQGDVISLLRPRARTVVRVDAAAGKKLTLSAALADAVAGTSTLAVGNLPRVTLVAEVLPEDPATLAAFTAAIAVKKGDVLLRAADGALAIVDSVQQGKITVGEPFMNWHAADPVFIARQTGAVDVKSATVSADGLTMTLELKPAAHAVNAGLTIALLDSQKVPFATPATVIARNGASIDVQPPLTAAEIADVKRVAIFASDLTIQTLQPKSPGIIVKVDSTGPFAVGDYVAAADATTTITTVDKIIVSKKQLVLGALIPVSEGSTLVALNWRCATTVTAVTASAPNEVVVGRENAVPPGSFVARRVDDDVSTPVPVKGVSLRTVTLGAPLVGVTRLDTLAVGVFPRIVTVTGQTAPDRVQIVEAGALAVGDQVVLVGDGSTPALVAQVVSAAGSDVVLSESLGTLTAGQQLATIEFRDTLALATIDAADATHIEVDRTIEFREQDIIGVLAHYADNSNPGLIESIQGNRLTLSTPGLEHGDGIVSAGWIDGGIVGPAAVSFLAASALLFPSQFQPLLRLVTVDGLTQTQPATAYGFDMLTGRFVSNPVRPFVYDAAGRHVFLFPVNLTSSFRYRPETLSLITTFNTDFPRAFATFAQKQQLAVSWIGCQQEFPGPSGCPGQEPVDVCAGDAAEE
jgi:hypothetical protein